jgi:polyphosphate kinase 2 (PPK2 family)
MKMKIHSKDFRVREGHGVDLKKWPTKVDPVYKSKEQYKKLLEEHVEQLSSQQQLLYASNRHAILLIFQAMDAAGKDGAIRHVMSGVNPKDAKCSASSIPAPPNWNTIFYGAPAAICRNAGGLASSTDPITRRY